MCCPFSKKINIDFFVEEVWSHVPKFKIAIWMSIYIDNFLESTKCNIYLNIYLLLIIQFKYYVIIFP